MRCWPPSRCPRAYRLLRSPLVKPGQRMLAFSPPRLWPCRTLRSQRACASIKQSWPLEWSTPPSPCRSNSRHTVMTRLLAVDPEHPAAVVLDEAVAVLRYGGVVAYLTDTVYGLAVDALRPEAIARLYEVKGRPDSKALPVIIGALEQLPLVVATVPATAARLMAVFWPGPLTLLLPPHERIPPALLGESDRIGVRWPASTLSQQLALGLGGAI